MKRPQRFLKPLWSGNITKHKQMKKSINCNGRLLNLEKPIVMGILNITPDSFYDGGKHSDIEKIKTHIEQMLSDGATIIDIGAYSSRPGAVHINETEELKRLRPVMNLILKHFPETIVSVDTFRSNVAEIMIKDYNAAIINDISSGDMDNKMFEIIAQHNVPYIIMHMQGKPQTMQKNPVYKNVVNDIIDYFAKKIFTLRKLAVKDIIIDPGFGFGKTIEHNYEIINKLEDFKILELPLLAGLSRKSMIYKYLNCSPQEALNGTTVLNTLAVSKGASILRVHDVRQAAEVIKLYGKTTMKW